MVQSAVSYIRVSTARDDMVSPEIQHAANVSYADRRKYTIVAEVSDLDRTGRLWKRRQAESVVSMVERHEADVILVWKWSRFARNRYDWAVALDRVEKSGGRIESSTEEVDATTSTGRFTRGMLAELAAFESDRIGDVWHEVHRGRVERGLTADGKTRFGYRRTQDGGQQPDPVNGPILAEMYRRYVDGASFQTITDWLNASGVTTQPGYGSGGPWTSTTLYKVLDAGFGAGIVRWDGGVYAGVQEPVIDDGMWVAYRAARKRRSHTPRAEAGHYLLTGILYCGLCGTRMCGDGVGATGIQRYSCPGRLRGLHHGGTVSARTVEIPVMKWLAGLSERFDTMARTMDAGQQKTGESERLAGEIARLDRQLVDLTVKMTTGEVPLVAYRGARDTLGARRETLVTKLDQVRADSATPVPDVPKVLSAWPDLDGAYRKEILRRLVRSVTVTPGHPTAHVEIVPVWATEQP